MVKSVRLRDCYGEEKYVANFGVETSWKSCTERWKRRCEDNIKMNIREIRYEGARWIFKICEVKTNNL
jgi:hypothetical protein